VCVGGDASLGLNYRRVLLMSVRCEIWNLVSVMV